MEHLIELRSRLIKAVLAFALTFILCFFFAKHIYNVLVWPFVWVAGAEHSKFIYTALLEYFITQLKLAMFGAAFLSFPVIAAQIYMFVAPGLYKHERQAFLPYLVATPIFFVLGAMVVYFLVMPMLVRFSLGMQQTGGRQQPRSCCCPRSANIFADDGAGVRLRRRLPVAGDPDPARAHRHHHLASSSRPSGATSSSAPSSLAAVLTPPDVLSQLSLAVPLLLLFEGSIWAVRIVEKRKARRGRGRAAAAVATNDAGGGRDGECCHRPGRVGSFPSRRGMSDDARGMPGALRCSPAALHDRSA